MDGLSRGAGLFEMKWIAEYADLHGLQFAPHGTADGLLGLAAEVQLAASLPHNYIALEYCGCKADLPDGIKNSAGVPNVRPISSHVLSASQQQHARSDSIVSCPMVALRAHAVVV